MKANSTCYTNLQRIQRILMMPIISENGWCSIIWYAIRVKLQPQYGQFEYEKYNILGCEYGRPSREHSSELA